MPSCSKDMADFRSRR